MGFLLPSGDSFITCVGNGLQRTKRKHILHSRHLGLSTPHLPVVRVPRLLHTSNHYAPRRSQRLGLQFECLQCQQIFDTFQRAHAVSPGDVENNVVQMLYPAPNFNELPLNSFHSIFDL